MPFDFDIFHISGCKLGIVDYLSRFPTFEAPWPNSVDEQYVVKCINRFFDACNFLDGWVRDCSLSEELSEGSLNMSVNNQISNLSASFNSIESVDYCQLWAICPVRDNLLVSSKDIGSQSVEGVNNWDIQVTSQCTESVEGDGYFTFGYIKLLKHFNESIVSPLEGVRICCQNSNQSALSWFIHVIVTFSAWITNYLPIFSLVWIFSTVICDWGILSSFVDLFEIISFYWDYCCVFVLFGAFPFQNPVMDTNANDSFEQLLNQIIPLKQHWFASDRARPRFCAGAVLPKRPTTLQRGAALKG